MRAQPIRELAFGVGEVSPKPTCVLCEVLALAHAADPSLRLPPPPALPRFAGEGVVVVTRRLTPTSPVSSSNAQPAPSPAKRGRVGEGA